MRAKIVARGFVSNGRWLGALLFAGAAAIVALTPAPGNEGDERGGGGGATAGPDSPALLALEALRRTRAIDLTHSIDEGTPHWPSEQIDPFRVEPVASIERHGYFARAFCMPEHYGTHLDAPNHFARGRRAVHELPPEDLFGEAVVIDMLARAKADPDAALAASDLAEFERAHGPIPRGAIVLVRTGWAERARDPKAYANFDAEGRMHFPGISEAAARFLAARGVRGVGIDTLSIDRGASAEFEAHKVLCGAEIYAIENLNERLADLPARGAIVLVLPIKLAGGSGGPARVVAFAPPAK